MKNILLLMCGALLTQWTVLLSLSLKDHAPLLVVTCGFGFVANFITIGLIVTWRGQR